MRKNKLFIAGLVTVFVALVSLTLVSSTWAKYTSYVEGDDSARVALWKWTYVEGTEDEIVFDLFNTVKDSDGSVESDVKVGTGETIIAPGTQGSFELVFGNASEVNASYSIEFVVTNSNNIPVEFSTNNAHWSSSIAEITGDIDMGQGTSHTVYWRWVFEGDDTGDTSLGVAGTAEVTVNAKVTWTQRD